MKTVTEECLFSLPCMLSIPYASDDQQLLLPNEPEIFSTAPSDMPAVATPLKTQKPNKLAALYQKKIIF